MEKVFVLLEDYTITKPDNKGNERVIRRYLDVKSKFYIDLSEIKSSREIIRHRTNKPYLDRFLINTPGGSYVVKGKHSDFIKLKVKESNRWESIHDHSKIVVKGFISER